MEGQILGGRYEIIEKIGGGGMAAVYKAKCRLLDRFVAVKILRPEYTDDEEFVKRFRIEAQAAASLSHPNIVSIYDVGQEGDTHYIVMEYINGITLKDYILKTGPLNWKDAVNIAIQICSAIEQAHRNHIVHRDIKPHNILLTREGIAKVTDFGIARAVSSSTLTMVGSTIGSVHYFSPEQARGGYVDEKSDLYSLGITLYEMVTGRVPFDGETPVAVALKHIQNPAVQPVEIKKSIPAGVNSIIMKAIRKEQRQRYQSASDLLSDLYRVLKEPFYDFSSYDDESYESPTRRMYALRAEDAEPEEKDIEKKGGKMKKKGKKSDRLTVILAVLTSLVIMLAVGYVTYKVFFPTIIPESDDFIVEDYAGKDIDQVRSELEAKKIYVKVKEVFSDTIKQGIIISQNVEAGQKLRQGTLAVIEFEVSKGQELIKIPDLVLQDYRTAEADLKKLGLESKVEEEFSDTVANGHVIRTEPGADEEVKPGTAVTVFRSKGPELKLVKVPDLLGKTRSEAQDLIAGAGLVIGKIDPEDASNVVDRIVKQYPPAETEVDEGTAVDIFFDVEVQAPEETDNTRETPKRKIVTEKINLDNPDEYQDKIRIVVDITPSDTNKAETILDEKRSKSSFPVTISIPVPENGTTKVRVFLDNVFYTEFIR